MARCGTVSPERALLALTADAIVPVERPRQRTATIRNPTRVEERASSCEPEQDKGQATSTRGAHPHAPTYPTGHSISVVAVAALVPPVVKKPGRATDATNDPSGQKTCRLPQGTTVLAPSGVGTGAEEPAAQA